MVLYLFLEGAWETTYNLRESQEHSPKFSLHTSNLTYHFRGVQELKLMKLKFMKLIHN
jgi:hypothetical protein